MRGYRYAVAWIARNDEPAELDEESVATFISVLLLADMSDNNPDKVAKDVVRLRVKLGVRG
jgi:hypothetical protein